MKTQRQFTAVANYVTWHDKKTDCDKSFWKFSIISDDGYEIDVYPRENMGRQILEKDCNKD